MRVVHVGTLPIDKMGTITRILAEQDGHEYVTIREWEDSTRMRSDVVVLHCFKKEASWFFDFERKYSERVVSLVHSTDPCLPASCSDAAVFLTDYSADEVINRGFVFKRMRVIPGAIDCYPIAPSLDASEFKLFGRACRNAPGKVHPGWGQACDFLDSKPFSRLLMFTDSVNGLPQHERASYDTSMKIGDATTAKLLRLRQLSVGVIANGSFMETFSVEALEIMAAGVPVVYLYQPALREVISEGGVCCHTMQEVWEKLRGLFSNEHARYDLALRANKQAVKFSKDRMIFAWEELLEEVTK